MAFTALSDILTNLDAVPQVKERTQENGGRVHTSVAEFTSAVFDALTAGQTAGLIRLPKDARVVNIRKYQTTESTTGAFDVGVYRTPINNGAVVSLNALAAGPLMGVGVAGASIMTVAPGNKNKTLAELVATEIGTAGATADVDFDIAVTILTVMGTASAVAFEIDYVIE